jgi:hypothetical protein
MKRYRIATLMTATLYSAIGLGALATHEPRQALIWNSTLYTMTAFILMVSVLMVFIQSGRKRFAWIGFSVFGWAYLLLLGFEQTERFKKPRLLTTWVLEEILEETHYVFSHSVEMETFSTVGHAFFALIFGVTGALLGYSLAAVRPSPAQDRTEICQHSGDSGK